jgi:dipeptidyl aminopeptidase/acylaminoacyl peptidase
MIAGNDDRIRAFLADEARRAVAAAPSLDGAVGRLAPRVGGRPSGASQRLIVLLAATLLLVAAVGTAVAVATGILRLPLSVDLGIFEPVAGRIVYYTNSSLWAVAPSAPSPGVLTLVRIGSEGTDDPDRQFASFTVPLGWSRDGTELLFVREEPVLRHLYILHADGTETRVTPEEVGGAAISPDGSRVVFAAGRDDALYVVDAEGGQPVRIAKGEEPTFSPDGTQIAYLGLPRTRCCVPAGREHVWVANADGTDAHEILANEPALAKGVFGLTWSPAGDRIAMENGLEGHVAIYTFAPDGSDFTKVITGGVNPHWSPDGSQIAYAMLGRDGSWIADADGSDVRTFEIGAPGPWHPGE